MTQEKVFISEADQYLFAQGTHYDIYKKLGAHLSVEDGVQGVYFGVWAPNAAQVNVIGTFNEWNEESSHAEAGRRRYLGAVHSRRGRGNDV